MAKETVGIVEKVNVIGLKGEEEVLAIVDTGAKVNSIDLKLASRVGVGKPLRIMKVKSPSRKRSVKRPVVKVKMSLRGRVFNTEANLHDRSHMKFPVIIGRNLLTGRFVVDVDVNKEGVAKGQ